MASGVRYKGSDGAWHVAADLTEEYLSGGQAGQVWTSDGVGAGGWQDASGGEVWEEVDLANFPTDWVAGDRVKMSFYRMNYGNPSGGYWTSMPNAMTITFDTTSQSAFFEFELTDANNYRPFIIAMLPQSSYVAMHTINVVYASSYWNSKELMRMYGVVFAGQGLRTSEVSVLPTNVSNYVYKMYRLRR